MTEEVGASTSSVVEVDNETLEGSVELSCDAGIMDVGWYSE